MTAKRKARREHVCTKNCLRWADAFNRRFYYCALTKPVTITLPRRERGETRR